MATPPGIGSLHKSYTSSTRLLSCYSQAMIKLISQIAHLLTQKAWTLSTCESCTGGLIAKTLTDIPGSSAWFNGGLVTYTNASKTRLAEVPEALIETFGVVSEPVAMAMAAGCTVALDSHIAVSVTGIAGPAGGTPEKPVGTVCFGWALPGKQISRTQLFNGDREQVRTQSLVFALHHLKDVLTRR